MQFVIELWEVVVLIIDKLMCMVNERDQVVESVQAEHRKSIYKLVNDHLEARKREFDTFVYESKVKEVDYINVINRLQKDKVYRRIG